MPKELPSSLRFTNSGIFEWVKHHFWRITWHKSTVNKTKGMAVVMMVLVGTVLGEDHLEDGGNQQAGLYPLLMAERYGINVPSGLPYYPRVRSKGWLLAHENTGTTSLEAFPSILLEEWVVTRPVPATQLPVTISSSAWCQLTMTTWVVALSWSFEGWGPIPSSTVMGPGWVRTDPDEWCRSFLIPDLRNRRARVGVMKGRPQQLTRQIGLRTTVERNAPS
ncbi:uncharacterized protein F5147DRAFT_647819 [Suillus discolor]|uniref:Uncharacterized protein n=1 Tax=Suillus discolor TaxID=1912936 RepID=A0A9P7FJ76_9AGAM|nr:uncharacterized protein F5147DRAFT_647819 [Suillus discolor]KAG2118661.1 hypothetical protein F5147DRAFT_647819 [Suillus discolor]